MTYPLRFIAACSNSCGTEKFLDTSISSSDIYSGILTVEFDGSLASAGTYKDMRIETKDYTNIPCPSANCVYGGTPELDDSRIIRCDNYAYFNQGAGCTVPAHEPVFRLSLSSERVNESAAFIKSVQDNVYPWGVKGDEVNWLTRGSKDDIARNRRAACSGFTGSKSCDEYPFASTKQGCYTGGSYINCNTGNVDISDNIRAGAKLNGFYRRARIKRNFSDDQFYVSIVP
jgi:hypothetical protein